METTIHFQKKISILFLKVLKKNKRNITLNYLVVILQSQKEQSEQEQKKTGTYSDETTLVAYLGYVPAFETYREYEIPKQETWYEPKVIYADSTIPDNINGFYSLARNNFSTLSEMINSQPSL